MNSIQQQINNDIIKAMKAKNVDMLAALRSAKSAIMLEATKQGITTVDDVISLKIVSKLVKQRKDSAVIFLDQQRKDLADDEINQLGYLEFYLPKQMEEDDIRIEVKEVIKKTGANSNSDIGKCMKLIMARLNGKADGSLISKLVREELS